MAAPAPLRSPTSRIAQEHDVLTGLLPGGTFERLLTARLNASAKPLAVSVIGIDRFHHVNELLGYAAGDFALAEIADRIKTFAGGDALVARLGGDEFALAVPIVDENDALVFAASLLTLFAKPVSVRAKEIFLSASVGFGVSGVDASSSDALLSRASQAMAAAKLRGGNTMCRAITEGGMAPEERYRLERGLRSAIDLDQLSLRYQVQIDQRGTIACLEALLLWQHPKLGRVDTSTFIRLAEETGLINSIGEWVLRRACEDLTGWLAAGLSAPRIAVNVSPMQLECDEFVEIVTRVLRETGVPGRLLELEVTESAILRDLDASAAKLAELRNLGVRIAMDDFGVGYSPLTYLHRLPLDTLKVDRAITSQVNRSPSSLPVVHTIAVMAQHRGLKVVAEGIESADQLELVWAARCDLAQGFYLGLPRPAEETRLLLGRVG